MTVRDNEPSVEEILRSIKRIIADTDDVRPQTAPRLRKAAEAESDVSELDLADMEGLQAEPEEPTSMHALLNDTAAQSVKHSLAALAAMREPGARPQIVRSGETSLEGMVREMLRPMLKAWLDENLPDIVERAIADEIARLRS